jgi:hypothetical protein
VKSETIFLFERKRRENSWAKKVGDYSEERVVVRRRRGLTVVS